MKIALDGAGCRFVVFFVVSLCHYVIPLIGGIARSWTANESVEKVFLRSSLPPLFPAVAVSLLRLDFSVLLVLFGLSTDLPPLTSPHSESIFSASAQLPLA